MDLIEVELARVVIQQKGDQQYIHLREKEGAQRTFPIVIGFHEIEEINRKLRGLQAPRPLTHDLVGRLIADLGWRLSRVIVTELRDGTFFANLVLTPREGATAKGKDEEHRIDCRPSDAIALAVQTGARMFVARDVFDLVAPGSGGL